MTSLIATAIKYDWPLIRLSAPDSTQPSPGKKPLDKNWETAPGLTTEQATAHLATNGNLGIRCGDGLLVVDCDGDVPPGLPETLAVQTGGGGTHFYYRVPPGITLRVGNTSKWIHPTTDTRGTGGQVVAPGSIHAGTGALYEWMPGHGPDDTELADCPQWVIDGINSTEKPPWRVKPDSAAYTPTNGRDIAVGLNSGWIAAALRSAVANVAAAPEGQRNDTLNREAFSLAGFHEISEAQLYDAFMGVATIPEDEARRTLASAIPKGREKPRTAPTNAPLPGTPWNTPGTVTITGLPPVPKSHITEMLTALPPDAPFRVLGHNAGKYYFLSSSGGQIVDLTPTALAQDPNLYRLAPKSFWKDHYSNEGKVSPKDAADALMVNAHKKGLFDKSRIRGRGAWHDKSRIVLHRGTSLLVDGEETPLESIDSRNVYQKELEIAIPYQNPLSVDETRNGILALCNMLCWEKTIYGNLLAGWLALAPICGVLDWRPHIWITGQSGTGKSYIQDEIIPILGSMVHFVQGSSTEAGVRQMLGSDALAVSFDESEPDGFKAATRISHILELARQASSSKGGVIAKGTASGEAMQFNIRSMFCMSSVAVGLARRSDQSRFTVLSMVQPPQGAEGLVAFAAIAALAMQVCSGPYADRFVARSCHMAPVIIKSARVFAEVFAAMKTNRRNADQIGALLAGYWSLMSDEPATDEDARIIVNDIDLDGVTPESDSNDEAQFLSHLMAKRIRCDVTDKLGHSMTVERTVSELINIAINLYDSGEDAGLQRHGMRCLEDGLFIASQHPGLTDLLDDTQWGGDWKRFVGRIPDAVKHSQRLCGKTYRGHKINYNYVFGAD